MSPPAIGEQGNRRPLSVSADHVVIAEGKDETDLCRHLLRSRRDQVQIVDARGRDNVTDLVALVSLDARFRSSGRSLGVVLDADTNPDAMFTLAAEALGSAKLPRPRKAEVIASSSEGQMRTGVFVTPGQGRTGAVEELYLAVIDPQRRRLAESYLAEVTSAGLPAPNNPDKAVLRSVLAALPRSPRHPGDGLQHDLVHDDSALEPLRHLLLDLTDEPEAENSSAR